MEVQRFIYNLAICVPGFLIAIVFHEYAHALMAKYYGDDTADRMGRLTFNPMAHIDMFGTILLPLGLLYFFGQPFGYAKPVPINPRYFKSSRKGIFWVSFAGPLANIGLGLISLFFLALLVTQSSPSFEYFEVLAETLKFSVTINLVLAVFNLIPFPPLDGSRMVSSFLDYETARKYEGLQRYTFFFFLLLWFTDIFSYLLYPVISLADQLMSGFITLLG